MQGWRPVEELIQWGFGHAPVVMANEAHSGLARCIRTREVGVRMIIEITPDTDPAELLSMEFTNWREREQAGHLCRLLTGEGDEPQPWVQELLAGLAETLAAQGGTTGILRNQAPRPLSSRTDVDALVVSTDNKLTGPRPEHADRGGR